MAIEVNDDAVIAEVRACCEGYNEAVFAEDRNAMNGFFWDSPSTVRLSPTEVLIGFDAIASFRAAGWKGAGVAAHIEVLEVSAFGRDVGVTNAIILRADGRRTSQSQTWVRFDEGWRIVSAHVGAAPSPE